MATNKTKPSKSIEAKYTAYKNLNRFEKNRERKIQKHLKKFPNDIQAKEALKNPGNYRKKPEQKLGWVTKEVALYYGNASIPLTTKENLTQVAKVIKLTKKVAKAAVLKKAA